MTDLVGRGDRRFRFAEIFLTALLSILGSAGASAIVMYVNVQTLGVKMEEHERRLGVNEKQITQIATANAALQAREDGGDKWRAEVEAQLTRIENKLDRSIESRGR